MLEVICVKDEDIPEFQALLDGNPSQEEYTDNLRKEMNSLEAKQIVLRQSVSLWTLLWLALGVGSAYRLGVGEVE